MMRATAATLILLCFVAGCAKRSPDNTQPAAANANEPARIASVDVVKAKPQELSLTRGESGDAIVHLAISKGYHVNANPPTYSYLIPTNLELAPANGISVAFITYPDALTKKFSFAEKPLAVYEGDIDLKVKLNTGKSTPAGTHNLSGKLRVQACDEQVCYPPGILDLTLPVAIRDRGK